MITIFQAMMVIFIIFAFTRVIFRFRDRQISILELLFWGILWAGVAILLFIPGITRPIANFLSIGRGIDVAVYFGIVLLFYLVFRLYVKVDLINHEMTQVVREISLKKKK